jgi:hypothetical protein
MNVRFLGLLGLALMIACAGCVETRVIRRDRTIEDLVRGGEWSSSLGEDSTVTAPPTDPAAGEDAKPKQPTFARVDNVKWSILQAQGRYTIRVAFFYDNPDTGYRAVHYANNAANHLRAAGEEAYVTSLGTRAILSVGTFDEKSDPELRATWRRQYQAYLERNGGKESAYRRKMVQIHGKDTPLGDQPWPVSVATLQIKMKQTLNMPVTEEDKERYRRDRGGIGTSS